MKNVIVASVLCVIVAGLTGASYLNLLELKAARDDMSVMQSTMNERMTRLQNDINRAFDTQVRHDGIINRLAASSKELKDLVASDATMQVAAIATSPQEFDPTKSVQEQEPDFSHLPQPSFERDPDLLLSPSQMDEQIQTKAMERKAFLASHFDSQDSTEWSDATNEFVNNTIETEAFAGLEFVSKDCKATTCRIEVIHGESEEEDMLINYDLLGKLSAELPRMSSTREILDGGKVKTTMYLTRRGESPPKS